MSSKKRLQSTASSAAKPGGSAFARVPTAGRERIPGSAPEAVSNPPFTTSELELSEEKAMAKMAVASSSAAMATSTEMKPRSTSSLPGPPKRHPPAAEWVPEQGPESPGLLLF